MTAKSRRIVKREPALTVGICEEYNKRFISRSADASTSVLGGLPSWDKQWYCTEGECKHCSMRRALSRSDWICVEKTSSVSQAVMLNDRIKDAVDEFLEAAIGHPKVTDGNHPRLVSLIRELLLHGVG